MATHSDVPTHSVLSDIAAGCAVSVASPDFVPTTIHRVGVGELVNAFFAGKSKTTVQAYSNDLAAFAAYIKVPSLDAAALAIINAGHGAANLLALQYKDHMSEAGLAPATINRRLSALRSLLLLAKTLGIIEWDLQVASAKSHPLRDTRGMGIEGVRRLLATATAQRRPAKRTRDVAILRLLFDLALRRAEVAGLSLYDLSLDESRLMVMGKGCTEKSPMTLPEPTKRAISDWLVHRGGEPGPLFLNVDRARKGSGLTSGGLYRVVRWLGQKSLMIARPHGVRHTAITGVLDLTGGNLRVAQRFARHASADTTIRYDDNRQDLGGEAARRLAAVI